ncbi:hypothetical protein BM1_07807 [Bipolaris maydis]|nr:hypothetical protein BM1_07807 [Bipolaris maydis]
MAHQIASGVGPDGVPSQDDWKSMNEIIEKKRAQNRLAQRNYRRNVKRRIEDLEQQAATQARLLALKDEGTVTCNQAILPHTAGDIHSSMDSNLDALSKELGKKALVTSDKTIDNMWYCHTQEHGNEQNKDFYAHLGTQVVDVLPVSMQIEENSQPRNETHRDPMSPESPTQYTNPDVRMLNDIHINSPIEPFQFSRDHVQGRKTVDKWHGTERASDSPGSMGEDALLTDGDATFE